MGDTFTNIMRRMTRDGVRQLEQLEVLILMARRPTAGWTAEDLTRDSMLSAERASTVLEQLHGLDYVEPLPGERPAYRLGQRARIDDLLLMKQVYERDRLRVVNEFFNSNLDILRNLAEAFKRRKGP